MQILESSDCLETLQQLQSKGLIRAIGMSSKTVEGGLKALDLLDLVMVTYNPSMLDDVPVIDRALALDKGVLIKKALNSGHDCVGRSSGAGSDKTSASQNNLQFALAKEGVSSVIVGTINPKHLQENVEAAQQL
jgi:aryl-alcohol dehydrogenase-like predicted oxidoreductase